MMREEDRKKRNHDTIAELADILRTPVWGIIAELEIQGIRPRCQDGFRTMSEQQNNVINGTSWTPISLHNVLLSSVGKKPAALAVDILDDNNPKGLGPSFRGYCARLAIAAHRHGLETGLGWGFAPAVQYEFNKYIAALNLDKLSHALLIYGIGNDPCHVQIAGGKGLVKQLRLRQRRWVALGGVLLDEALALADQEAVKYLKSKQKDATP